MLSIESAYALMPEYMLKGMNLRMINYIERNLEMESNERNEYGYKLMPEPDFPAFTKVVRLGTTTEGKRSHSVYVKIEYRDHRLALSGVVGPTKAGNCVSCGQICDSGNRPFIDKLARGWTYGRVYVLWATWINWHLNDLRACCAHQTALGWKAQEHLGEPCPECGYPCGSQWLAEPVPTIVLRWLSQLPDADRQPAWV